MSLVNLDGTAIFGAGSEWFWSMAQFVLVAASIFGIYVQLRAQRASSLTEQTAEWETKWLDEAFVVTRLAALVELDGRRINAGLPLSAEDVGNFFERLGYLTAQNHLRSSDVWHSMRGAIGIWWTLLGPYLEETRKELGNAMLYEWFEKLEVEMRRLDVKAIGRELSFGTPGELVAPLIDRLTTQLRVQGDARNGIYPIRRVQPEPVAEA